MISGRDVVNGLALIGGSFVAVLVFLMLADLARRDRGPRGG